MTCRSQMAKLRAITAPELPLLFVYHMPMAEHAFKINV
jgi:hypothetical protein